MFDQNVGRLHELGPLLLPVEIIGIFLPLVFHLVLGVVIFLTMTRNDRVYRYGANIRYTLQRVSGVIAILFVLYHLYHI